MSDPTSGFKVEMVELSRLKNHPQNYQQHPDDQLEHIIESIRANGVYRNIVVARDDTLLAGHGVTKALSKMGRTEAPVIRLDLDPNDPRALKILAGDNEISHLAMRDDRALTELLKVIKEKDEIGLLGTGYDELMLASLVFVTRPASEVEDFDAAAHWVGMPEYEEGEDDIKITVQFRNKKDRDEFVKSSGIGMVTYKSGWWPPKVKDDSASLLFDG